MEGLASFFRDYGSPIAWGVAAIGWFVSSGQANKRERRKELRSEVDDVGKALTAFLEKASVYYNAESEEPTRAEAALEIKAIAKEVDFRLQRIDERRWSYEARQYLKDAQTHWNRCFDTVTGDSFETDTRMADSPALSIDEVGKFLLRNRVTSIQIVEALHRAVLAQFD